MVVEYKREHWSIDRLITSSLSERRHTDRTGKRPIKNDQCGSNPPKGHATGQFTQCVDSGQSRGRPVAIAHSARRYATDFRREIRTVPVRFKDDVTRLGGR